MKIILFKSIQSFVHLLHVNTSCTLLFFYLRPFYNFCCCFMLFQDFMNVLEWRQFWNLIIQKQFLGFSFGIDSRLRAKHQFSICIFHQPFSTCLPFVLKFPWSLQTYCYILRHAHLGTLTGIAPLQLHL